MWATKEFFPGTVLGHNQSVSTSDCHVQWYNGVIFHKMDLIDERNNALSLMLECDPSYVKLISNLVPDEKKLAEHALKVQPSDAESWFWAAGFLVESKPGKALEMYRKGIKLNPKSGIRWLEYGNLLAETDPDAAVEAYWQSCLHGDPGWNGCQRAGSTAEGLGNYDDAVRYYKRSYWKPTRERGIRLEELLLQGHVPEKK